MGRRYEETEELIVVANNPDAPDEGDYAGMKVRYTGARIKPKKFTGTHAVFDWSDEMGMLDDTQERLYAIYLDQKNKPLGYRLVGAGGTTGVMSDPKVIFGPAIALHAPSIMLLHNHPSGDPMPSPEDKKLTRDVQNAGKLLGVRILDHVVVGRDGYMGILHDTSPTRIKDLRKLQETKPGSGARTPTEYFERMKAAENPDDSATQLFEPDKAEEIAVKLRVDDPDWDYRVVHDPKGTGYSFIEIYDEDGEFVARF